MPLSTALLLDIQNKTQKNKESLIKGITVSSIFAAADALIGLAHACCRDQLHPNPAGVLLVGS